ncbi:hypothetical protein [Galbibacter mesophilus]|uniref:hypothetical protein n=1 Tax=Galbibacter mesophilus TaxID=379069 RepID=UPI00191FB3AE|nr:hypothetical protein [Galbibacter mesophilus]MCM5661419.1 hypothetical protein [Galbibacter mesophilus]
MPANKKYLTHSPWQRFAKISAAFLGSYLVTVSLHLAIAGWFAKANIVITMTYSGFIIWSVLMVVTFLVKNGWKIWGLYLLLTLFFFGIYYFGKTYNPTF